MELLAAAGADDPAGTLRPLLTAALDNALEQGDAALTGPIVRGDVNTVRAHLADIAAQRARTRCRRTSPWRGPPLDRAVTDGRLLPIRAAKIRERARRGRCASASRASRRVDAGRRDDPAPVRRAHPRRSSPTLLADAPGRRRAGRVRADDGRPARRATPA